MGYFIKAPVGGSFRPWALLTLLLPVYYLLAQASTPQTPLLNDNNSQPVARLVASCKGYEFPKVICINRYGSVIHGDFERKVNNVVGEADTYHSTSIRADPSFKHVAEADFLVWDEMKGNEILGSNPTVEFMFTLPDTNHEGPVYAPNTNELYFSRFQSRFLPQIVIDLNFDPPVLTEKVANPPIYAACGGRYRNGLIYWVTLGGDEDIEGHSFRPGVYMLNTSSGESRPLLNNYYGYYFNGLDDMDIDDEGTIWFTDVHYGRPVGLNSAAPQLMTAAYRFSPSTGHVSIVEGSLTQPNGVQLSPSGSTIYLTDTGAGNAIIDPAITPAPPIAYNSTKERTVYAFDIIRSSETKGSAWLRNKRPIYHSMDYVPDGIKASKEGLLVTATGHGIDLLSAEGRPLVRVQTNFSVVNIAFAGRNGEELWAVGKGGAARVRWGLRGPVEN